MRWKLFPMRYSVFFWVTFLVTTGLFVLDRFVTNLWPRQNFTTEHHKTATDYFGIKPGPASYIIYQVLAMGVGRYSIACLNALFFTMMHTTHNFLSDSWVGINLIDFSDDVARVTIHKLLGISIAITTLLHVWSILFPVVFNNYKVMVKVGFFNWPLSEIAPAGFKDVSSKTETVMLEVDDVYRLALMTILLGPILYYSYRWMASNYRVGIRLHQFLMLMYFIDICRRHTHPHCWVLNIPVFMAWLFDRIWGHYYAGQPNTSLEQVPISSQYMLVLWKNKERFRRFVPSIGDVFYMRSRNTSCCCYTSCLDWEREHPFTAFSKRNNIMSDMKLLAPNNTNKLIVEHGTCSKAVEIRASEEMKMPVKSSGDSWDTCVLVRTYTGSHSHTKQMKRREELYMDVWGGFRSGDIAKYVSGKHDVILVGGGSGSAYLIDALLFLCANDEYLDMNFIDNNLEQYLNKDTERYFKQQAENYLKKQAEKHLTNSYQTQFYQNLNRTNNHVHFYQNAEKCFTENLQHNSNVDADRYFKNRGLSTKRVVGLIFTTNDLQMVEWWVNTIDNILSNNNLPLFKQLKITIALTCGNGASHGVTSLNAPSITWGKVILGRCNFEAEMKSMTSGRRKGDVFCQGGQALRNAARIGAASAGMKFHDGHSYDNGSTEKKKKRCDCSSICSV